MSNYFENNAAKWAELHEHIQDLIAGYADDELESAEVKIVEAHLVGCELCRNDLVRQQVLNQRLDSIPTEMMPATLKQRIDTTLIDELIEDKPVARKTKWSLSLYLKNGLAKVSARKIVSASGWGVAVLLAFIMLAPTIMQENKTAIPMIQDALVDYHKMKAQNFPVANSNAKIEAPIKWANAHVLATWMTKVAGSRTQVFAIRSGYHIVFQYQIDENVFFRNPVVRQAIARSGNYMQRKDNIDVLALPLNRSGVIVVGPADSLPRSDEIKI